MGRTVKALIILGTLVSPVRPGTPLRVGTKAPGPGLCVAAADTGLSVGLPPEKEPSGPEVAPSPGVKPADPLASPDPLPVSPAQGAASADVDKAAEEPAHRLELKVLKVNSKRIRLNYEVKDVGQSGISDVELWYTQDGRTWQKHGGPPQRSAPYVVEVEKEDLYGFTLVGKNGVGLSKQPPQPGDMPQVWVEVDLTKPVVRLLSAEVIGVATPPTLMVLWSAADKNLSDAPITLSCAAQTGGPWLTLAGKIENTGRYEGKLPAGIPSRFLVRVEAADQAGNVGMAETPYPILADVARPSVSILGVAPAAN